MYAKLQLGRIKRVSAASESKSIANQPENILLIGNNERIGLSPSQAKYFGTGAQVGGARSDVTMIAHLDPASHTITLLSIPRDLFMPIPGTTTLQRVDAALNLGPNQLIKTIELDLGIPIQHFVMLNFDSFQGVVDALGGVQMYFPMPVKDHVSGLNVTTPGCHLLDGFQALQLVRSRELWYRLPDGTWHYDGLADLSRIRRAHIFLTVVASQVKARGLSNPLTVNSLISSVVGGGRATVDSQFSEADMVSLALGFRHVNPTKTGEATLPIAYANNFYYRGAYYGDVAFPQEPSDTKLIYATLGMAVPAIPPRKISLSVVNGSAIPGQEVPIARSLSSLGYKVISTSTTPSASNPSETVIYYTPGNLAKAEVLKNSLSGAVIMGEVTSTLSDTPLEILTGSQLGVAVKINTQVTSVSAPSSSAPSSSAPKASTTATSVPDITSPTQINLSETPQPWDPRACST